MSDFYKDLEKKYGKGVFVSADTIIEQQKKIISMSPKMDIGLSGGIPEGTWILCSGSPKRGKALSLDSMVMTINGPIPMSDIRVGDTIISPTEETTKVIGVYPQGKKACFRVYFRDGEYVDCCGEHLWEVFQNRSKNSSIVTTQEMIDAGLYTSDRAKFKVRLTKPVEFKEIELQIDPYIMGALIGDGCFTKSVKFTNTDTELLSKFNSLLDEKYELRQISNSIDFNIVGKTKIHKGTHLYNNAIKYYGLYKKTSHYKFIPHNFKYNSYVNRIKLIQGLFDTDGYACKDGSVEYSTTSYQLALDIKEIIESIGGLVHISDKFTTCNDKIFKSYLLKVKTNDNSELFSLSRKKNRCFPRTKKPLKRTIVRIEQIEDKEMQCIKVDSKDGLFLTNNYIVTHNTSQILQTCANAQKQGKKVIWLDVEHRLKKLNLSGIEGLDTSEDKFHIVQSQKGKILTAEEFLDIATEFLKNESDIFLVIDSVSALCASAESIADVTAQARNAGPKLMGNFWRKSKDLVPVQNSNVVMIIHLIANTSGYGAKWIEDGGQKIQYACDIKIRNKKTEDWLDGDKIIGIMPEWEIETSALGPPCKSVSCRFKFGKGIDKAAELMDLAFDFGLISKAGAWYNLDFALELPEAQSFVTEDKKTKEKSLKLQGEKNVYEFLVANPSILSLLEQEIKQLT